MTGSSTTPRSTLLEVACFDAESAVLAWEAGADRIELCKDQHEGGTTPSLSALEQVKERVDIPVFVMIRPRGGDFVYSVSELRRMLADINAFKALADGFVLGVLDTSGDVDVGATSKLVRQAHPLPCTFHRAVDETKELGQALEDVVTAGCRGVLSSGGKDDASAGIAALRNLGHQAGGRIQVIPGGGVRAVNVREIQQMTGAAVVHSSAMSATSSKVDKDEVRRMKALIAQPSKLDRLLEDGG